MKEYHCKKCGKFCSVHVGQQIKTGALDLFTAMYIEQLCYKCFKGVE